MSDNEEDPEGRKRRADSENPDSMKKKQKKDDENEDSASECETKAEKKLANMRRNIREVMDETQLDEATLSAQRQEMERLRRVQEQQRIIREVQRQIAINRQNNKTQTRVISLLQGKQNQGDTTISESTSPSSSSQVRLPSSVMLKVNSSPGAGSQTTSVTQAGQMPRRSTDGMRWQKGRGGGQQPGAQTSISRVPSRTTNQSTLQQRIRMMTPSVSISPVVPKKEPIDRTEYFSDSEMSDLEGEEALHEKQMQAMRKVSGAPKSQKPAKGKDVVTISSSSESSDDDCIVLSDPSGGEETDNDDDPANSGMHTNDRYNLPDEHGRVLINVGHPDTEPDVYLAPQVARIIKPHQIGGIRFLFDNIVESIERYKNSSGFGCILAHSMGLGKTLQVASFCDIFFRCTTAKTVLCIMPINTLQNWLAEFNMWLPYEDPSSCNNEQKNVNSSTKTEPIVETKQEIKDEVGSQSDMSNMSRPISTESANPIGQEGSQQSQMMSENNPYGHNTYENQMMPQYGQDGMMNKSGIGQNMHMQQNYHGGISQNSMYGTTTGTVGPYDPMKQDMNCQGIAGRPLPTGPNYGINNQPPGNMYPGMDGRTPTGQMYPEMDNRNSTGQMYPGINSNAPTSMYPNYENPSQQYGNYPPSSIPQMQQQVKKEEASTGHGTEVNIKVEPEDSTKKEDSTTKDDASEEKKTTEKVETPFCVDAPIGVELRPRHFRLHILNDSHKTMAARSRVILDWQKNGGVLLIGYELYRQLSLKKSNKAKRKRNQPFKDTVDVEEEDKNKGLLDDMHGALVSPGPDLVICDEGHRIKNSHASISMALKQMRTKRRIVLTGYPLQNNLLEYWCMVDFVRPNYLGTKSEFCNMFERPIQNGQCIDSTPQDIRLMRYRAHVLHALLEGFVQRRSHSVLQISLPRKEEYILLVRMTPHQRKLYDTFMNQVVKTRAVPNPLKAFAVCCKIWNHPDILYHFLRKRQVNEEDDLDLEETIGEKPAPGAKRTKARAGKGEPKKGKKVKEPAIKNKPAASVPPNSSSSSSNDNAEGDQANKSGQFSNFTPPVNNANYQSSGQQSAYPQGYQNYRSNEQNNYYRNEGGGTHGTGEYNEFYNNPQGQQRYGNQSQSFQPYAQTTPGYNSSQNYNQNQQQAYVANASQSGNPRFTSPSSNSDFRPEQSANGNYDTPGMFPRPYGFQEQGRTNYTPHLNQGTNNYTQSSSQSSNFQAPMAQQAPNVPMNEYSGYGANQSQNYPPSGEANNQMYPRSESHQPMQTASLGYPANQQNQNSNSQTQSGNYMANQTQNAQSAGSQSSNAMMHGSSHNYPSTQQNQSMPIQSQQPSHGYQANQLSSSSSSQSSAHGYSSNQQASNTMTQNHPQGFIPNTPGQAPVPQNTMRGYTGSQQNQSSGAQNQSAYPTSQSASGSLSQSQTHGYPGDRQGPTPPTQNSMHGYPSNHLGPPATPQSQGSSYPTNQQNQSSTATNYSSNQQQIPGQSSQNPSQIYGSGQASGMSQGQTIGYPASQQNQSSGINQSEQQMYPRSESQTSQNYSATSGTSNANYMSNPNQSQNSMPNYSSEGGTQNQSGQYSKGSEDPYWQRNYPQTGRQEQCNDQYFREPSSNRYQNNYYPGQNYGNSTSYDGYTGTDDPKNPQPNMMPRGQVPGPYDKNVKDTASGIGGANNASSAAGYNGSEGQCTNMPRPQQPVGTTHSNTRVGQDPAKDEDKDKDDVLEKEKEEKSDDEILAKDEEKDCKNSPSLKEEPGIPYDWVRTIFLFVSSFFIFKIFCGT